MVGTYSSGLNTGRTSRRPPRRGVKSQHFYLTESILTTQICSARLRKRLQEEYKAKTINASPAVREEFTKKLQYHYVEMMEEKAQDHGVYAAINKGQLVLTDLV